MDIAERIQNVREGIGHRDEVFGIPTGERKGVAFHCLRSLDFAFVAGSKVCVGKQHVVFALQRSGFVQLPFFPLPTGYGRNELPTRARLVHRRIKEFELEYPDSLFARIFPGKVCVNAAIRSRSVVNLDERRHLLFEEQIAESLEIFPCFDVVG